MESASVMSVERRELLDSLLETWAKQLRIDGVLIYLHSKKLFNEHVIELVKDEKTPAMQSYELIKQLKMRGNNAFVLFYYALIHTSQSELARLLETAVSNDEKGMMHLSNAFSFQEKSQDYDKSNANFGGTIIRDAFCELLPNDNHSSTATMLPSSQAIQQNERYYKDFDFVKVKEPSGILKELKVDFVDSPTEFMPYNPDLIYPNFSSPRGLALIINNRYFQTMPERLGTDVDEINLNNLLQQLNYSVAVYRNLCSKELLLTMRAFARRPEHLNQHSCIVFVLTHGENGELYGVDDIGISVLELVSCLNARNCPALAHKPKLFFLQACRGQLYDHGFGQNGDNIDGFLDRFFACAFTQAQGDNHPDQLIRTPIEADILISYATTPGYVSWRNSMKGSWYVQSICEIFAKYAKSMDVLSMLTMVNKQVAEAYESSSGSFKQIPDHSTRLRRTFYFFPGLSKPTAAFGSNDGR